MKPFLFFLTILVLIGFLVFGGKSQTNTEKKVNPTPTVSQVSENQTQEKEEAQVTVKVTPKQLKVGEKPAFEIAFDTHSVDLSFDVAQTSSVVDEKGTVLNDSIWNGAQPGGHHREGTLTFNTPLSQTKYVELVIENVAGVSERRFRWNL